MEVFAVGHSEVANNEGTVLLFRTTTTYYTWQNNGKAGGGAKSVGCRTTAVAAGLIARKMRGDQRKLDLRVPKYEPIEPHASRMYARGACVLVSVGRD